MKKIIIFFTTLVMITLVASGVIYYMDNWRVDAPANHTSLSDAVKLDKIMKGVHIGPVDVSGMSVDEAAAKVQDMVSYMQDQTLTVNIGDAQDTIPVGDTGFTWTNTDAANEAYKLGRTGNIIERFKNIQDIENETYIIPLKRAVNDDIIEGFISQEADAHNKAAVDASIIMDENGELQVTEGSDGMEINTSASLMNIKNYLTETWNGETPICDMKVDIIASKGSVEELSQVKDVLGRAETDFSSSSESRFQNIVNGASKINGKILYPGEQLSVLDCLLPFEPDNGYSLAPSYIAGQIEDTFGGGICQVSTTLYNAVLKAELQVDERHNHSMMVSYVDPSKDAAIAEGSKDFKFTNNLDHPIYIDVYTSSSGIITATIFGVETRSADRQISFESEVLSTTKAEVTITADPSLDFGYVSQTAAGHDGMEACLWKVITENGETTREEVNTSEYITQDVTYVVGTSTSSTEAKNAIYTAIDSNSIEKVYSVIDSYS